MTLISFIAFLVGLKMLIGWISRPAPKKQHSGEYLSPDYTRKRKAAFK